MAGYPQSAMVPGPVQYKRKYTLWVLIVLIIFCWPVAIIYYFTRPEVPVQELNTYTMPYPSQPQMPPPGGMPAPLNPGGGPGGPVCPRCGKPATWVAQYGRWYCYTDQQYI